MPKPVPPPKETLSWKTLLRVSMWLAILGVVFYGAKLAEGYLSADPRFLLKCAPQSTKPCPAIEVKGAVYTNPARLQTIFAPDFGKSLFQIPLPDRRAHLLAIDWVNTASVSRIWPDRLSITVTERKPVAFAKLPVEKGFRMSLIDAEGVLLSIPLRTRFQLPILAGVTEDQKEADRKVRVEAMDHLLEDLGPEARYISEVNTTSMTDVRLIADVDGTAVELIIGDQHYRSRLQNFLKHYADIRQDFPKATIFDLRSEGRIIAR